LGELANRRSETAKRIEQLRSLLKDSEARAEGKASVFATGSFGRREASQNSDLDLFIVGKKNTPVNHEQGTTVVGANPSCYYEYSLDYWNYPAGGHPVESLYQQQETAEGVSVSIKI